MKITQEGEKRKSELLDIALNLFSEKGYVDTSIQDILNEAGVSKGAFYHYFESKEDVLDQIINQYINEIIELSHRIADDPALSAMEKYRQLFYEVQQHRKANWERFKFLLKMLMSERNSLFINRYTEMSIKMVKAPYIKIIKQGKKEGVFDINHPELTAGLIIRIGINLRTELARMYIQAPYQPEIKMKIPAMIDFTQDTVERLLGVKPGTFEFISESYKEQFKK
jgi:AcrR family transcriptional regulator